MKSDKLKEFKLKGSIQEYLSLGYIYLLVLGISSYSIFYGLIGINIISYSSVLDIMLSPVIIFTDNIIMLPAVITMSVIGYFYGVLIQRIIQKKFNTTLEEEVKKRDKLVSILSIIKKGKIYLPAFVILFIYIGYAVGGGYNVSNRIKSGNLKIDHVITYNDGEKLSVELVGNNSQYVFYIAKGTSDLTVSPVVGNIKKIEKLVKIDQ